MIKVVRFFDNIEVGPSLIPDRHLSQGQIIDSTAGAVKIEFDADPRFIKLSFAKIKMTQLVPLSAVSTMLVSDDESSTKGNKARD